MSVVCCWIYFSAD